LFFFTIAGILVLPASFMRISIFFITLLLLTIFSSCQQPQCDDANFNDTKWTSFDSTTKYSICKSSPDVLRSTDSVHIILLGTLNAEGKVVRSSFDSLVFVQLSSWKLGTTLVSDSSLPGQIKAVLNHLTKNSVWYLRLQLLSNDEINMDNRVVVYFTETTDSIKALSWLNTLKGSDYVDSLKYISKTEALHLYLKDSPDMGSILETNPLPASAEIFIKPHFYRQTFLDSLKHNFIETNLVSDMTYKSRAMIESQNKLTSLLKTPFIIKIKT
jgi:hypothetical protein